MENSIPFRPKIQKFPNLLNGTGEYQPRLSACVESAAHAAALASPCPYVDVSPPPPAHTTRLAGYETPPAHTPPAVGVAVWQRGQLAGVSCCDSDRVGRGEASCPAPSTPPLPSPPSGARTAQLADVSIHATLGGGGGATAR